VAACLGIWAAAAMGAARADEAAGAFGTEMALRVALPLVLLAAVAALLTTPPLRWAVAVVAGVLPVAAALAVPDLPRRLGLPIPLSEIAREDATWLLSGVMEPAGRRTAVLSLALLAATAAAAAARPSTALPKRLRSLSLLGAAGTVAFALLVPGELGPPAAAATDAGATVSRVDQPLPSEPRYVISGVDGLNLRAGPGTDHAVVTILPPGEVATATGATGGADARWRELVTQDGARGWANDRYLERID
jgi:hypothetical protein